ncbi:MAG: Crp/Fnr family transcriptional regulator [Ginsengibacter sp.]
MLSQLVQFFSDNNIFATREDIDLFQQHTYHNIVPKNTIIMQQSRPVEKLYFINKGILRLCRQHNNDDTTIAFIKNNEFASTIIYLLNEEPSPCAIVTSTEVDLLYWKRSDFLYLKQHTALASLLETALTGILLTWNQDREVDKLSMDPKQRYIKLLNTMPAGLQEVPAKHIASYLGIHTDSLSRIRKRLTKKY